MELGHSSARVPSESTAAQPQMPSSASDPSAPVTSSAPLSSSAPSATVPGLTSAPGPATTPRAHTAHTASAGAHTSPETSPEAAPPKRAPKKRRKKVEMACVYCRRSHMICDDTRPCQRCIKRGIGSLCYDEPSNQRQRQKVAAPAPAPSAPPAAPHVPPAAPLAGGVAGDAAAAPSDALASAPPKTSQAQVYADRAYQVAPLFSQPPRQPQPPQRNTLAALSQEPFFYSEHAGSEFSSLNDFLSMIDDPELVSGPLDGDPLLQFGMGTRMLGDQNLSNILAYSPGAQAYSESYPQSQQRPQPRPQPQDEVFASFTARNEPSAPAAPAEPAGSAEFAAAEAPAAPAAAPQAGSGPHAPVISDSARDKFFLTAADPTTEISPEERLKQVIKAKLEAGLLQPYNYAKGYARLQSYMDNYMNVSSRQRILKPLSVFRPAFRAIARTLKDVDLVLVEESFERMLLDYDRVFTSMAIPACLWRRTGEIYRGNKEFASLVGVSTDDLKDGKLAIYELMSEESAVNFWEKYGAIAFDKGQKAVLTSCNLRTRDGIKRKSCCFSFTIRRDRYNIPSCIVGNFIPIDPVG
ncbi:Zn(2)-C6 fungal-type domain-containing protein [[Candida] zeylanoides]